MQLPHYPQKPIISYHRMRLIGFPPPPNHRAPEPPVNEHMKFDYQRISYARCMFATSSFFPSSKVPAM